MHSRISGSLSVRYVILGLVAIVTTTGLVLGLNHLLRHPSHADAADIVYGELLTYENLHGDPHVVFQHRERVYFDHLRRDYKYLLARQSSGWLLTGKWYFIPATDDAASVGVARCTGILGEECGKSTEIFGQINSTDISTLEVEFDGEWRQFEVSAPGYAVRLDGFRGVPTGYRWLGSDGDVVFQQKSVRPLDPGR